MRGQCDTEWQPMGAAETDNLLRDRIYKIGLITYLEICAAREQVCSAQ